MINSDNIKEMCVKMRASVFIDKRTPFFCDMRTPFFLTTHPHFFYKHMPFFSGQTKAFSVFQVYSRAPALVCQSQFCTELNSFDGSKQEVGNDLRLSNGQSNRTATTGIHLIHNFRY